MVRNEWNGTFLKNNNKDYNFHVILLIFSYFSWNGESEGRIAWLPTERENSLNSFCKLKELSLCVEERKCAFSNLVNFFFRENNVLFLSYDLSYFIDLRLKFEGIALSKQSMFYNVYKVDFSFQQEHRCGGFRLTRFLNVLLSLNKSPMAEWVLCIYPVISW